MNQHENRIKLVKRSVLTGKPVTSQESVRLEDTSIFYSDAELPTVRIWFKDGSWVLQTRNGMYVLKRHKTQGYYVPENAPVKMHIFIRPMGGEIIYWLKASALKKAATCNVVSDDDVISRCKKRFAELTDKNNVSALVGSAAIRKIASETGMSPSQVGSYVARRKPKAEITEDVQLTLQFN